MSSSYSPSSHTCRLFLSSLRGTHHLYITYNISIMCLLMWQWADTLGKLGGKTLSCKKKQHHAAGRIQDRYFPVDSSIRQTKLFKPSAVYFSLGLCLKTYSPPHPSLKSTLESVPYTKILWTPRLSIFTVLILHRGVPSGCALWPFRSSLSQPPRVLSRHWRNSEPVDMSIIAPSVEDRPASL